jgi:hypothetical protein
MPMREPTKQEIAKFKRACKALDELGKAGFHIYLANDTMHMMVEDSHTYALRPNRHAIRESVHICGAGGGDW